MTPRSDRCVNSLHKTNEMSVRQVLRMKIIVLRGVIVIYNTNSHDHPTKNSVVPVGRMNVSILTGVSLFFCFWVKLQQRSYGIAAIGRFRQARWPGRLS